MGQLALAMLPTRTFDSSSAAFAAGLRTAWTSVFAMVMSGTYVGIGALAHEAVCRHCG